MLSSQIKRNCDNVKANLKRDALFLKHKEGEVQKN